MSSFQGIRAVVERHGLFGSLYADRGSHYWTTTEAGKVDKDNPTQVHRALRQLGIELIPAYSPEARGRSERMFGTLQGRLPQELRLAGVTDMEAANRFLAETFLPEHNRRFRDAPGEAGSAFVAWTGRDLADIASRRNAWWATTTPCATSGACFRSRPTATVTITSSAKSGSMNIPTAGRLPRPPLSGPLPCRRRSGRRQRPCRGPPVQHRAQGPSRTLRAASRCPAGILDGPCARCFPDARSGRRDGPAPDRTKG